MKNSIVASLLILVLSGCSLLPSPEPAQVWTLEPVPAVTGEPLQVEGLRVLKPQTSALMRGRHMLVVPEGKPPEVYAGVRWSSAIPELWRNQLISALQRDSRFSRISSDEVRLAAERVLVSRLDAFQTEYRQGEPVVVIRGHLQLVEASSRRILAEYTLDLSRKADHAEVAGIVAAFSALSAEMVDEIREWLLAQQANMVTPASVISTQATTAQR